VGGLKPTTWTLTQDVEAYAERAWPLLARRPAEHTVALTVVEDVRRGRRWSEEPVLFGFYEDGGEVRGAVSLTPPYELLLAVVPPEAVAGLVAALLVAGRHVPGVNGEAGAAARFAAAWTEATGLSAGVTREHRL
jgi:hypothetical protein